MAPAGSGRRDLSPLPSTCRPPSLGNHLPGWAPRSRRPQLEPCAPGRRWQPDEETGTALEPPELRCQDGSRLPGQTGTRAFELRTARCKAYPAGKGKAPAQHLLNWNPNFTHCHVSLRTRQDIRVQVKGNGFRDD